MDNDLISSHAVSVGKCACGGGACSVQQHGLCFLSCRVTHARTLPLCRSPGLATSQLSRVCSLPCLSDQIVGSRESSSVPTSHTPPPRAGSPGHGHTSSAEGGACHLLSQGHVSRVQQKLLPAVGAHQPHRLLVQAHLPEATPSHERRAWPLPGRRGSHSQTEGWLGREEGHPEGRQGTLA